MKSFQRLLTLAALCLLLVSGKASAADTGALPERVKGNPNAPITMIEYSSMTCSHCADFYNNILPEIEKRYIDTGKVKFIYRDFPVDGIALKAAALASCMPQDKFFPFVTVVYHNRAAWLGAAKPEAVLKQYAMLAGLGADKAQGCLDDTSILDKLVAERTEAMNKYSIEATPTFIINDGQDRVVGAQQLEAFTSAFDKILAKKKQ